MCIIIGAVVTNCYSSLNKNKKKKHWRWSEETSGRTCRRRNLNFTEVIWVLRLMKVLITDIFIMEALPQTQRTAQPSSEPLIVGFQ